MRRRRRGGVSRTDSWVQEWVPHSPDPWGRAERTGGGPNHDPKLGRVRIHGPDKASKGAGAEHTISCRQKSYWSDWWSSLPSLLTPQPFLAIPGSGLLGGGIPKGSELAGAVVH